MRTVITYGTFDMFHIGHLNLLRRCKELGDKLIVAVSTDEFNLVKGKKNLMPYEQRAEIVGAIKYVDQVIPESDWEQKPRDIQRHRIDTLAMGSDWEGKFDYLAEQCKVVYLERTQNVSTTMLKDSLSGVGNISKTDLINALEILDQLRKDLS